MRIDSLVDSGVDVNKDLLANRYLTAILAQIRIDCSPCCEGVSPPLVRVSMVVKSPRNDEVLPPYRTPAHS